jgi:outer membrane protein
MLNNLQVKQGRAMVQIGENAVKQSKRTLLPNLNFNTNYYLNYGRSLDYSTYQFVNQTLQSNTYNLSSQLSLYQGGIKGNTIKQAGYDLERSKLEQESLIENIKLYVITAYLQVLFAEEQQKIAEQQEAIAEKQYSDAKKLVNAGTIPEGNLLSLEAQLAADAVQVANTQNAVELAYLDLKNLMQISHLENIKIVYADIQSMQNLLEADIPDEQTVIDAALLTQPGIKKFAYQLKSNALAVKIAQGAALPSVFVGGSLGTSYSNAEGFDITGPVPPDPFGTQIGNNFNGGLGLSVTIPIFNNGQMLLNKQNAMLNYLTTEVAQQSAINDLKKSVVQAVTNCKAARVSYNAALKSYDAAIKSFEFEQKKFNAGQSNSLNYTIAENTMRQAEITLLQAKYDFIFKRKVIDYYLGLPLNF